MNLKYFSIVFLLIVLPGLASASTKKAPDRGINERILGVNTVRGGTTTTGMYQFLFADKKDDVHHGEWLSYQVAILNLSNEELNIPYIEVGINNRFELKNITTPNSVKLENSIAAPTLKTKYIRWEDISVPVGKKVTKVFLARVPDKGDPSCLKATAWIVNDNKLAERSECNTVVSLKQKTTFSLQDFSRVPVYFKQVFKKSPNIREEAYWNKRLTWLGDVEKMKKEMIARAKKGKSPTI